MLNEELIYDEAFAEKVRRSFWRDGLIVAMPSQLKKRKVLLDLIALDFESGRTYTEQEVNTSPPPSMSWRRALAKSRILTRLCWASCCLRPP